MNKDAPAPASAGKTYRIDALGHQGDGIAHENGSPVFIPFALPGETVALGPGPVPSVLDASPSRIAAPCPHFGTCGGCVAQHMDEATYTAWKHGIVADALRQQGFADAPIARLIPCAQRGRRRAVFTALRQGASFVLGYHARRSHDLIDVTTCVVLDPQIVQALPALKAMAEALAMTEVRMTVLATLTGLDIALVSDSRPLPPKAATALPALAATARAARISYNGEPALVRAMPRIEMGRVAVVPPPGAFVQAVAEAEDAMRREVIGALGKAKSVADLFCGLGAFTYAAAEQARVLAADSDKGAVAALALALRHAQGLKPVDALNRDLFRDPLSPMELKTFDVAILDPPRAGAQAQAEALARSTVPTVCYVSCNPATFARDVRILADGGYILERVTPIDQFLYSAHVEVVGTLRRESKKKRR